LIALGWITSNSGKGFAALTSSTNRKYYLELIVFLLQLGQRIQGTFSGRDIFEGWDVDLSICPLIAKLEIVSG
jgi:hypothetical protein